MTSHSDLKIDELARETGVSVRTIRYYQELGLIDPPERRGRSAHYDHANAERLRRIAALREEGLSLDAIARLLDSPSDGQLRFMRTLLEGSAGEEPELTSLASLRDRVGADADTELAERALASSFFNALPDGQVEIRSPALMRIGAELAELAIPVQDTVDLLAVVDDHLGAIADSYIDLFVRRVWRPAQAEGREVPWEELSETLIRLRALAGESVTAAFALLMTDATEEARVREMEGGESLVGQVAGS